MSSPPPSADLARLAADVAAVAWLEGDRVTVIEDVLTTGGAAIDAIEKVRAAGATVIGLVAVLDREEGAADNLRRLGVPFTPLFRRSDLPVAGPDGSAGG